jgi:hypothetical protein
MENPLAWAKRLLGWTRGEKHPETPRTIFRNVHDYDRVRRIIPARCAVCDYVVSQDAMAVREIIMKCNNSNCCSSIIASKIHQVCNLCYDMHHALYLNPMMKNMNYFKNIDEKMKADYDQFKRRDRNP